MPMVRPQSGVMAKNIGLQNGREATGSLPLQGYEYAPKPRRVTPVTKERSFAVVVGKKPQAKALERVRRKTRTLPGKGSPSKTKRELCRLQNRFLCHRTSGAHVLP